MLVALLTIFTVARQILAPLGFFGKDFSDAIMVLAYFVISLVYMMVAEWLWRGQTLGKRVFGLRVLDTAGRPLNAYQAVLRSGLRG